MYTLTYLSLLPHLFGLFCHPYRHCLWRHWYRLQRTKWQHSGFVFVTQRERERERGREKYNNSPSMSCFWKLIVTPNFRPFWGFFKAYLVGLSDSYETSYDIINLSLSLSLSLSLYIYIYIYICTHILTNSPRSRCTVKNVLVYVNFVCWLPLYSAVIHSIENTLLSRIYSLYLLLLRFWMSDCSVLHGVLNIHWSGALIYSAVCLLHGWCHVRLLPSRRMFGVHHATMHQFTVSLEATYIISFWYWKFYSCIRSVMSFFLVFFLLFFSFTPFSCSLSEIRLVRILL